MKQTKLLSNLLTKEVDICKANAKTAFKLCTSQNCLHVVLSTHFSLLSVHGSLVTSPHTVCY